MSMQKVSVMVPPLRVRAARRRLGGRCRRRGSSAATPASARACRSGSRRFAPSSRSTAPRGATRAAAPTCSPSPAATRRPSPSSPRTCSPPPTTTAAAEAARLRAGRDGRARVRRYTSPSKRRFVPACGRSINSAKDRTHDPVSRFGGAGFFLARVPMSSLGDVQPQSMHFAAPLPLPAARCCATTRSPTRPTAR